MEEIKRGSYQERLLNAKLEMARLYEKGEDITFHTECGSTVGYRAILAQDIKDLYENAYKEYQQECNHPLWYLYEKDFDFGIHSYNCICLKCGIKYGDLVENFNGKAISDEEIEKVHPFDKSHYIVLKQDYDKLVSKNGEKEAVNKLLRKYKNR